MPSGAVRASHWDFMLESGTTLRTWSLVDEPAYGTGLIAEALADHRVAYLNYEGPLSGGRGAVTRWDEGAYETLEETVARIVVSLRGQRLVGRLLLEQIADIGPAASTVVPLPDRPPEEHAAAVGQRWFFNLSAVSMTSA
jgi:hypothetical protein